jgi:hypothetical protein
MENLSPAVRFIMNQIKSWSPPSSGTEQKVRLRRITCSDEEIQQALLEIEQNEPAEQIVEEEEEKEIHVEKKEVKI